jgi:hypothetical protein
MKWQRKKVFGMKLVHWCLHGKENNRAKQKDIHTNLFIKGATDTNYDATVIMIDLDTKLAFAGTTHKKKVLII